MFPSCASRTILRRVAITDEHIGHIKLCSHLDDTSSLLARGGVCLSPHSPRRSLRSRFHIPSRRQNLLSCYIFTERHLTSTFAGAKPVYFSQSFQYMAIVFAAETRGYWRKVTTSAFRARSLSPSKSSRVSRSAKEPASGNGASSKVNSDCPRCTQMCHTRGPMNQRNVTEHDASRGGHDPFGSAQGFDQFTAFLPRSPAPHHTPRHPSARSRGIR